MHYSAPGETVLDQMMGGGTTLVECKLTGRHAIGVDISLGAVMLTHDALNFAPASLLDSLPSVDIRLYQGDARDLDALADASVDLIATHPPYASIVAYSSMDGTGADGDLSLVRTIGEFVAQMRRVAEEAYRVLKPGRYCAILIGDTRRRTHYVPLAFRVMQAFLEAGFILKEDVIKAQWNTRTERAWAYRTRGKFLLIMHEHLFVFRKPGNEEPVRGFRESMRWWG